MFYLFIRIVSAERLSFSVFISGFMSCRWCGMYFNHSRSLIYY